MYRLENVRNIGLLPMTLPLLLISQVSARRRKKLGTVPRALKERVPSFPYTQYFLHRRKDLHAHSACLLMSARLNLTASPSPPPPPEINLLFAPSISLCAAKHNTMAPNRPRARVRVLACLLAHTTSVFFARPHNSEQNRVVFTDRLSKLTAEVAAVNPDARVESCSYGKVSLQSVLDVEAPRTDIQGVSHEVGRRGVLYKRLEMALHVGG